MHTVSNLSDIESSILNSIYELFPLAQTMELTIDQNMLESGVVDSMGLLTIIQFVEADFDIFVEDEEVVMENFGSVSTLAHFVSRKLAV